LPFDIGASMLNAAPALEERIVSPAMVELCLTQGRRLRCHYRSEGATLTRLIRSVEAA
jgi:transposase